MKALEITVNGEYLYTVGADEWRAIGAQVWGQRINWQELGIVGNAASESANNEVTEQISLLASVTIPDGTDTCAQDNATAQHGQWSSLSYETANLSVGDVVTIKLVETDQPDVPDGDSPESDYSGRSVAMRKSGDR